MNNKEKGSGLVLIILLLVALLIGYHAMTQMDGLGFGTTNTQTEQTQQNAIEQAQSAVDAINSASIIVFPYFLTCNVNSRRKMAVLRSTGLRHTESRITVTFLNRKGSLVSQLYSGS